MGKKSEKKIKNEKMVKKKIKKRHRKKKISKTRFSDIKTPKKHQIMESWLNRYAMRCVHFLHPNTLLPPW